MEIPGSLRKGVHLSMFTKEKLWIKYEKAIPVSG